MKVSPGPVGPPLASSLRDTTFVVLDLETTGLSPAHDRITEIGAVTVRGGQVVAEFRTFVRPGRAIPPAISALTGITDTMVHGAPPVAVAIAGILPLLERAVLVAHHAPFDLGFLQTAAAAVGYRCPNPVVIDTVALARRLLVDEVAAFDLATLTGHLRTRNRPAHRALDDARATMDLLHDLLDRAGSWDVTTLGALCRLVDDGQRR